MIEIIGVEYKEDYKLELEFNTGERKIVDLLPHLHGEVFEPLKDKKLFIKFGLEWGTIVWENEADFAPEFLYDIGVDVEQEEPTVEDTLPTTGTHN
ncbi:DUF2442 domain-containing protein [Nostoc linckia FACHB-104]|nr:DUF2442 domain-containing protein [Nostoc linckia FACHB-104]